MQNIKSVRHLNGIAVRLLHRQLESRGAELRIPFQLRIGLRRSKFAGLMHWQLKFRCGLLEIRALFQQRLREIGRAIGEFL